MKSFKSEKNCQQCQNYQKWKVKKISKKGLLLFPATMIYTEVISCKYMLETSSQKKGDYVGKMCKICTVPHMPRWCFQIIFQAKEKDRYCQGIDRDMNQILDIMCVFLSQKICLFLCVPPCSPDLHLVELKRELFLIQASSCHFKMY